MFRELVISRLCHLARHSWVETGFLLSSEALVPPHFGPGVEEGEIQLSEKS